MKLNSIVMSSCRTQFCGVIADISLELVIIFVDHLFVRKLMIKWQCIFIMFSFKQIPVTSIGLNDVMFNSKVRWIAAWLT